MVMNPAAVRVLVALTDEELKDERLGCVNVRE